jgi:putative NADH-flavin reductase
VKILLLGATGNSGQRLLRSGLARGHDMTVFVRNEDKLIEQAGNALPKLKVVVGDVYDGNALAAAMQGQEVVINAAGNVNDGDGFVRLIDLIATQAERVMGKSGRLWIFAGAALLDIPGTDLMGTDLPKIPAQFQRHKKNYQRLKASGLDWSMLCPGPMIPADDGRARNDLRLSADIWPFASPTITRFLPRLGLLLLFGKNIGAMTISYEDAAAVIMDNLGPNGQYSRKRVGIALPPGVRGKKKLDF